MIISSAFLLYKVFSATSSLGSAGERTPTECGLGVYSMFLEQILDKSKVVVYNGTEVLETNGVS
jgi:hypothetical protein